VPEFPELRYREVMVVPYRFFYRVKGDVVWVVGVWHGAQLPILRGRLASGVSFVGKAHLLSLHAWP
jgi:hypothetical protein